MGTYTDSRGVEWESAEDALTEFLSDIPYMEDDDTEAVFQFTDRSADAAFNLAAIAHGVTYAGMSETFDGFPVPYPAS